MPLIPALALLLALQNKADTYGKTNAAILAMGRTAWYRFYTAESRGGESTAGMSGAEGLYGDALAWRNDRLGKARIGRLRRLLQDTKNDAVGVGTAISGGGTIWNITAASLYADAEETLYAVLTKTGKAPKRRVSDVERGYAALRKALAGADLGDTPTKEGREALARLRRDLDGVVAEAARRARRESDALLDFCVRAMKTAQEGGG